MAGSKSKAQSRWIFGIPLGIGILLTASDGYWFPLANLAGIAFIILGSLLCRSASE
jgi:hypothetical protein